MTSALSPQRTFEQLAAEQRGPRIAGPGARLAASADAARDIGRAARRSTRERSLAMAALEARFAEFLRRVGVGGEFQSSDFTAWLAETGERPTEIDGRATGAIVRRLSLAGVLRSAGYRTNAGSPRTNYNATPRIVWRVERVPDHPSETNRS